jgi:hypothetical protein
MTNEKPKIARIGVLLCLSLAAVNAVRNGIANMPRAARPEPQPAPAYRILSFSNRTLVFEYNHVRYTAEKTPDQPGAEVFNVAGLVGKTIPEMECPDGQQCPLNASMTQNLSPNFLLIYKGTNQTPALTTFSIKKAK